MQIRAHYCVDCRGVRPFGVSLKPDPAGGVRAVMRCQVCSLREEPVPGIRCRWCAGTRFKTLYTRQPAPGVVLRVKKCRTPNCRGKIRTAERLALAGA